jgi:hypothetical protein
MKIRFNDILKSETNSLSFAVFAFAVEDMKARDWVITLASPCAFLNDGGQMSRGVRD